MINNAVDNVARYPSANDIPSRMHLYFKIEDYVIDRLRSTSEDGIRRAEEEAMKYMERHVDTPSVGELRVDTNNNSTASRKNRRRTSVSDAFTPTTGRAGKSASLKGKLHSNSSYLSGCLFLNFGLIYIPSSLIQDGKMLLNN